MVLPTYRLGPSSVTPEVPGLPLPEHDPYRGLGTATIAPQVDFQVAFGDLLGNRRVPADDAPLCLTAGDTDPLNGPAEWPAVNAYYAVGKPAGTVTLSITLAAVAQALMPAVAQRGDAFVQSAQRQRDFYASAYCRYAKPGLAITVETTLESGASLAVQGAAAIGGFAAGGYVTAAGAALYGPVMPAAAALGDIVSSYGIGWDALATVNGDVPLSAIFGAGAPISVPAYVVMASGDSASGIASVLRSGWPAPTASEILSMPKNHSGLPLRVGALLPYPSRALTIPSPAPRLGTLAAAQATSPGWLASDSALDAILVAGFTFTVDGVCVVVGQTVPPGGGTVTTFATAVAAFADLGIQLSTYDLGQSCADADGLLIPGAVAHSAHYAVTGEATLAANPSGVPTTDLVAANVMTADLYEAGALIYLGDFGAGAPPTLVPAAEDTLSGFAARYDCPPAALLRANATRGVIADTALAIPGAVTLPASDAIFVPYTVHAGDILSGIAAGFDLAPAPDKGTALAERNGNMPGTVTQGLTFDVNVGGAPVLIETTGLTSFAAVLAKVQETASEATLADVAAAFETPGRLAAGGLLVCPPALLAAATAPAAIRVAYGVSPSAFGLANAGVTGLVAANVVLVAPDSGLPTVTTVACDTLNSIVGRFNDLYLAAGRAATATIAGVIDANPDVALFAAEGRALLAPADIVLTAALSASGPYPNAAFPLTVELVVKRTNDLVHAGFEGSSVEIARATVAAPAATPGSGGSMTFDAFERALTEALPDLRLATAKLDDHAADLWAVDFGAAGITSAAIFRDVAFGQDKLARLFALAPLYGQFVSRAQVPVAPLVAGRLDPAHTVYHDYQGIDVEIWAARFLSDFDRLLGPETAAAINDIVALRPQYTRLMSAKADLQAAIPADLACVFKVNTASGPDDPRAVTDPKVAAGLAEAKKVFGQTLGVSLSSGRATAAIVQYDATVNSAWTRAPDPSVTAALYGEARAKVKKDASDPSPTSPAPLIDSRWRLAAGKVSLSETAPFLTLPLEVSDPGAQSHLLLDLEYAVSNLEIHHLPVNAAPGGARLDWLAMTSVLTGEAAVPASLGVDLGLTNIPIPLKDFPALPRIIAQACAPDPTQPPTLATAALYAFRLVYSHEHAGQDHVMVTAEFNLSPPLQEILGAVEPQDLFATLAQYVAIADDLNGLLMGLRDPRRRVTPTTLVAAVTTFADLARVIADKWGSRLPKAPGAAGSRGDDWIASKACPFSAVVACQSGSQRLLASYTLTRLDGAIGPHVDWPQVECQTPDGSWAVLVGQNPIGDSRTYAPSAGAEIALGDWPSFALSLPGLNAGGTRNARVKLEAVRNTDLLGLAGPATADAFVYRTAVVTATDIVTPAIGRTDPLSMAGANVEAALEAAFDALFPPSDRRDDLKLTMSLFYGDTLVPGPDPLVSELPVALISGQKLTAGTAAAVAGVLQSWKDSFKPNSTGGMWVVSLMLHSSFDPGKRVLLSLDRMTYALT